MLCANRLRKFLLESTSFRENQTFEVTPLAVETLEPEISANEESLVEEEVSADEVAQSIGDELRPESNVTSGSPAEPASGSQMLLVGLIGSFLLLLIGVIGFLMIFNSKRVK